MINVILSNVPDYTQKARQIRVQGDNGLARPLNSLIICSLKL
jgi:hypothetical protein